MAILYTDVIENNNDDINFFGSLCTVMGKILFKSILSTSSSTQPKKYLKYKYKYVISKVFKIQVPKYLLLGLGGWGLHRNA